MRNAMLFIVMPFLAPLIVMAVVLWGLFLWIALPENSDEA